MNVQTGERTDRLSGGWIGWLAGGVLAGGLLTWFGIELPQRGPYLAGLAVLMITIGALLLVTVGRLLDSRVLRLLLCLSIPMLLAAGAALLPGLMIGKPDSRPLWQRPAPQATARLLGERLYVHDRYYDQVLDPDDGRTLISLPSEGGVTVGSDGSFVQRGESSAVYRGPDGRQRWRLRTADSPTVLAIAEGWVVLRGCRAHDDVCGVGPDGRISWRESETEGTRWLGVISWERRHGSNADSMAIGEQNEIESAADIAVRNIGHGEQAEVYTPAHRRLSTITGRALAVGGDLVVTVRAHGAQCRFIGYRASRRVFGSDSFSCAAPVLNGSYLMLTRRMYFLAEGGSWNLDLGDGSLRRVDQVAVDNDPSEPAQGIGGDDVIVRSREGTVVGLDAATGSRLWTHPVAGDRPPGISVSNGAVTVLSALPERAAALAGIDPSESPKLITVLDARSGAATAHRVLTGGRDDEDEIWDSYGYAPGKALVTLTNGGLYAFG